MKTEEFKAYVEDISKNNTCHRPDISMYGPCDPCAYTEYCLCFLNTRFNPKRSRRRRKES